jgi:hypothetical protein
VSLEELDLHMEERDRQLDAFEARLNDPDREKALAAMKLLIEKGDPEQRRLAIRHGLYSPDLATRSTVLRAILDSNPSLVIHINPLQEEPSTYYFREIKAWSGSLQVDNSASILMKIAGYDAKEDCWIYKWGASSPCGARLTADVVSLNFGGSWSQYTLNAQGELVGRHTVQDNIADARVSLVE